MYIYVSTYQNGNISYQGDGEVLILGSGLSHAFMMRSSLTLENVADSKVSTGVMGSMPEALMVAWFPASGDSLSLGYPTRRHLG